MAARRRRVLLAYTELLDYRVPIFSALGNQCDLTVTHSGSRMTADDAGFREIVLPRQKFWRFHNQRGLHQLIESGDFEVVIYFMDIAWISIVTAFLRQSPGKRRVIWGLWRTKRLLPDLFRILLARYADFNLFYSQRAATDFIALGVPSERVAVARNTVRVDHPARNGASTRDAILVVGSFNSRKRNDITVSAFAEVAQTTSAPVRLVFVGAGPQLNHIRALAQLSGVADRIEFHPSCHDPELLRGFYDQAICSVSHGQAGLSVLQSFAYGVPFVTSRDAVSGGEIENISNGVNGHLTDGTREGLVKVLRELIEEPCRAEALGNAALQYYRNHASAAHMIHGFLQAIGTCHSANP